LPIPLSRSGLFGRLIAFSVDFVESHPASSALVFVPRLVTLAAADRALPCLSTTYRIAEVPRRSTNPEGEHE